MGADVDALLQNLKGSFSQLPQGGGQQALPAAAPIDYASMLAQAATPAPSAGGDDAYQQMLKQALPNGWQSPQAPYTPPPPPAPSAPPPALPAAPSHAQWWANSGMDANVTAPGGNSGGDAGDAGGSGVGGGGEAARGGRIGFRKGGLVAPTEAQKHAGNYKKHHVSFHGLPIAIENPKGSVREGKGWKCVMPADYGYIKRTEGADGDHLDVFIGPDKGSQMVFVINQNDHRTGQFDEHKAMLAYSSERAAVADYLKAFNDGKGADRIRSVEPMSLDAFKHWLKRGRTKTPAKSKSIVEHALALTRSKQ